MTVVRISMARFAPEQAASVTALLDESQATLIPAIEALPGIVSFFAGIDAENGAMTNVSVWETEADAKQLASLKAMTDLAQVFIDAGVTFERPITNHEVLWSI